MVGRRGNRTDINGKETIQAEMRGVRTKRVGKRKKGLSEGISTGN